MLPHKPLGVANLGEPLRLIWTCRLSLRFLIVAICLAPRARVVPSVALEGSVLGRPSRNPLIRLKKAGGRDRDRTCDPYHVKVVLSR